LSSVAVAQALIQVGRHHLQAHSLHSILFKLQVEIPAPIIRQHQHPVAHQFQDLGQEVRAQQLLASMRRTDLLGQPHQYLEHSQIMLAVVVVVVGTRQALQQVEPAAVV
jgi:hypothetical protein